MYARITVHDPPAVGLAALRCEPGFSGALTLVHPVHAGILVVVFWETEEQARRPRGSGEVWEVAARI
jgi:hypothetical protein